MSGLRCRVLVASLIAAWSGAIGCSSGGGHAKPDAAAGAAGHAGTGAAGQVGTDGGAGGGAGAAGSNAGSAGADAGAAGTDADTAGTDAGALDVSDATHGTLPDFADGTRLKALAYATDDGQKLWHGWFDSQRNEACTFSVAVDGKMRCLPPSLGAYLFADTQCKVPLATWSAMECGELPAYFATENKQCATGELHKRLAKIAKPAAYHDIDPVDHVSCASTSSTDDPPGLDYWTAGDVEPATAFVAAEEIRDARGPALMARYLRAEDGALQLLGAFDVARAHACAATPYVPDTCTPDPLPQIFNASNNEFSDSACTKPTAVVINPVCNNSTPPEVALKNPSACATGSKGQLFRVGASFVARPFIKSGNSCAQSTSGRVGTASLDRHELAETLLPAAFPAVRVVDEGQGRLKVRTVETPDGQHLAVTRLIDALAGGTCSPFAVDGKLRCLPDDTAIQTFEIFVDPACKQRGYVGTGVACTVPKFVKQQEPESCALSQVGAMHYFEVGPPVTPQQTFINTTGVCMLLDAPLGTVFQLTERPLTDAPLIGGN